MILSVVPESLISAWVSGSAERFPLQRDAGGQHSPSLTLWLKSTEASLAFLGYGDPARPLQLLPCCVLPLGCAATGISRQGRSVGQGSTKQALRKEVLLVTQLSSLPSFTTLSPRRIALTRDKIGVGPEVGSEWSPLVSKKKTKNVGTCMQL